MPILIKSALSFALGHWRGILFALAFAALGLKLLVAQSDARHWHKESDRYAALYKSEQLALAGTIANYRAAAKQAEAEDAANKARVEREQTTINSEVSHDYATRIADLRRRYDAMRVRNGSSGTHPGGGSAAGLPSPAQGTEGTAPAADQEGLPLDDRLICSAQAEQLDSLITWVERQSAVPIDSP